jgi:hypothetical protein
LNGKSVKAHYDFLQPLIGAFKALQPHLAIRQMNNHMLALMGPKQLKGLVAAALGLPETRKAQAIAGLGAGLAVLERPQQEALIAAALGLPYGSHSHKGQAIAGLGAGLEALEGPQQQALVTAALGLATTSKRPG